MQAESDRFRRLKGRRVLICGGSSPVGSAIAQHLAGMGASISVHFHSHESEAAAVLRELPLDDGQLHCVLKADLRVRAEAVQLLQRTEQELGKGLDLLVNAAWPTTESRVLEETTPEEINAHLAGVVMHANVCGAAVPSLRLRQGAVVLVGGALSRRLFKGFGMNGAAKAAATTLTQVFALEEGPNGIRANVVAPGRVDLQDTGTGDGAEDISGESEGLAELERIARLRRCLPTLPTAADVASVVGFLALPESRQVTGQVFMLTGGEPT